MESFLSGLFFFLKPDLRRRNRVLSWGFRSSSAGVPPVPECDVLLCIRRKFAKTCRKDTLTVSGSSPRYCFISNSFSVCTDLSAASLETRRTANTACRTSVLLVAVVDVLHPFRVAAPGNADDLLSLMQVLK